MARRARVAAETVSVLAEATAEAQELAQTIQRESDALMKSGSGGGKTPVPKPNSAGMGAGSGAGDDELVSMAQAFSGLPMNALIGGPLNAASEANQQMGLAQINFLMNTCFMKVGTGATESYTPVMVSTSVTRNVIDAKVTPIVTKTITAKIELPLFALLPINTLGVTSVNVDFTMDVSSSYSDTKSSSNTTTAKASASYSETVNLFFCDTTIKGNVSVDSQFKTGDTAKYQKKNSATYKVSVAAAQLPLPPGVTTLITAFTQNITPISVN